MGYSPFEDGSTFGGLPRSSGSKDDEVLRSSKTAFAGLGTFRSWWQYQFLSVNLTNSLAEFPSANLARSSYSSLFM